MQRSAVQPLATRCRKSAAVVALLGLVWVGTSGAAGPSLLQQSSPAVRTGGQRLDRAIDKVTQEVGLTCFQDSLTLVLNPGCFSPPAAGNCATTANNYFIQYITPQFPGPYLITGLAFISNDAATVFPKAGIVLIPSSENRFPSATELDSLQASNLKAAQDLAAVTADLSSAGLVVQSGTDVVVCLLFPAGQQLTGVGVGPGIVVDEVNPDQNCDFFTIDKGTNWYRPVEGDPLDWGFEVLFQPVAVEGRTWSDVKALFRNDRPLPYANP